MEAGTELLKAASRLKGGDKVKVGSYRGFDVLAEKNPLGLKNLILRGRAEYATDLSASPVGNAVKIENLFNSVQNSLEFLSAKIEQYEGDMAASKEEYEKPFAYEEDLKRLLARQRELDATLDLENRGVVDADLCENLSGEVVKEPDAGAISEGACEEDEGERERSVR